MKTIRYVFWALVGLCLILVGLANRDTVTVRAMPEDFSALLGLSTNMQVPLFVVIFLAVGAGLLIGFLWEWLREHRIRADSRAKAREITALKKEIAALKAEGKGDQDDVLALLDGTS